MTQFTNEEKHKAALREAAVRRRVYDRLVNANDMTRQQADKQIAIMDEIAADYAELAKKEKLL